MPLSKAVFNYPVCMEYHMLPHVAVPLAAVCSGLQRRPPSFFPSFVPPSLPPLLPAFLPPCFLSLRLGLI